MDGSTHGVVKSGAAMLLILILPGSNSNREDISHDAPMIPGYPGMHINTRDPFRHWQIRRFPTSVPGYPGTWVPGAVILSVYLLGGSYQ
eukprot:2638555-Rhodomonas_salina.1